MQQNTRTYINCRMISLAHLNLGPSSKPFYVLRVLRCSFTIGSPPGHSTSFNNCRQIKQIITKCVWWLFSLFDLCDVRCACMCLKPHTTNNFAIKINYCLLSCPLILFCYILQCIHQLGCIPYSNFKKFAISKLPKLKFEFFFAFPIIFLPDGMSWPSFLNLKKNRKRKKFDKF